MRWESTVVDQDQQSHKRIHQQDNSFISTTRSYITKNLNRSITLPQVQYTKYTQTPCNQLKSPASQKNKKALNSPTKRLPSFTTMSRAIKTTFEINCKADKTSIYNHPCCTFNSTYHDPPDCSRN